MEDNNINNDNNNTGADWTPGSTSANNTEGSTQAKEHQGYQQNTPQTPSTPPYQGQQSPTVNVSFDGGSVNGTVYSTATSVSGQYSQGCIGAAWSDMKKSGNWLSKTALMGLIEFIPILNWVNSGYALRWGRQLIFGKIENLQGSIFGERTFVTGAMAFLISFIVGLVSWLLSAIFGIVPLFGLLVGLCITFFLNVFNIAMNMRAAVFNSLGDGFSIDKIWRAIKDNFWKAFVIMLVPGLICGLIACGIGLVVILANGVIFGSDFIMLFKNLAGYVGNMSSLSDAQILQIVIYIAKTFVVLIPGVIVASYFMNWLNMIAALLTYRAFGHFIARYAINWRSETSFMEVERQESTNATV